MTMTQEAQGTETSYLTTGGVARRLGVSRNTVLRAAQRGEIRPAARTPGGYLRFDSTVVEAYAARLAAWAPRADGGEASAGSTETPPHA